MVAASSKSLVNPLVGECLAHAEMIRKGFLAPQWSILDETIVIAHQFILGTRVYPALGAAITAVEMASTRAVELTVQAMTIQLPLMALENPGRFALSAIRRWLGYAHGVRVIFRFFLMGIVLIASRMLYGVEYRLRKRSGYSDTILQTTRCQLITV